MKSYMNINRFIIALLLGLSLGAWCNGEGDIDAAPMEKAEQEALYKAIQGFVGNWWNGSDLYPDPCGWTPIEGVSCDIYDGLCLESLEFRSNPGLIGQIPTGFGRLMKLQSLVLLENGLSGELPTNIGYLTNLKKLVISGNWLNGHVPDIFGGLSELLILDLSGNSLSGSLPLTFRGLTSLLKLDLSNNQLEGNIPKEIGYLKNITLLDLRNNKLSGGLAQSLQELYSLEEMVLSNNPIGGDLKSLEWKNLQNLIVLDLSSMGLIGEIPESMAQLKRLRFLGLNNNKLTGNLLPKLASMPCISALYINGNNLSGELQLSAWFYEKMGRRFGAWNNPNLCYPFGLVSTSHIPYGVKRCQQEVAFLETNSKTMLGGGDLNQNSDFMASLGFSNYVVNEFWWVLLLESLMVVLFLSCFI
ncbi:Piriformospora indica-insensitive protein 2 [Melia azedarach]|uniref:Piriformospora indica-insensitive protein 2 n=1 Tax=Melia azedarach TaxID=155640 RepID=A0ACC1XI23_MELAZ|nr:Piriformospora indica-insensitive protein 2 [Melia azedarach]